MQFLYDILQNGYFRCCKSSVLLIPIRKVCNDDCSCNGNCEDENICKGEAPAKCEDSEETRTVPWVAVAVIASIIITVSTCFMGYCHYFHTMGCYRSYCFNYNHGK